MASYDPLTPPLTKPGERSGGPGARRAYAPVWRLYDALDGAADRLLPARAPTLGPVLMLAPALALTGLLAWGFLLIAGQSLHVMDPNTFLLRPEYSLGNYRTLLGRAQYGEVILRTLGSGVLVALIAIALAFPYAYALVRTRSERAKRLLLICAFLPFLLGAVIRGYAWLLILGRAGLVNEALGALGLPQLSLIYNYTGVMIGLVQLNIPLAVMLLAPALTAISAEVEEAGQSLGAHWLRVLRTIVLPMAVPGLANAFVVIFTLTFSEMVIPSMLGGGREDFIANAIFHAYVEAADTGTGAALCVVTTLSVVLTVAGFALLRRLGRRRGARS